MKTLNDALLIAQKRSDRGYTFLNNADEPTFYPFSELVPAARRRGQALKDRGLVQGDRVALIIPEPEEFVLTFLGATLVGLVPVPMYPPLALGKLDGFMDTAARILNSSGARLLVTTKQVSTILWGLTNKADALEDILVCEKLKKDGPEAELADIHEDDPCFLQFTSGSTSDPKGVVVTHKSLMANARAIMVDGLDSTDEDVGVSWLPLYHDMGLIGFVLAPLTTTVSVVFIPTLRFVKRPRVWMETMAKYKGSITFAPNFAFALATKYAPRQIEAGIDLSSVRVIGCGAEPINPDTLARFNEAFAPAGLDPRAIMPCYGMAEATLAMSFDRLDQEFSAIVVDRETFEVHHRAEPPKDDDTLRVVACGRTFPGHELGIIDDQGHPLPEGHVGEIVFSGPSLSAGYFENEAATKDTIVDGWLRTGDLGFMVDGQIYVSGRKKDLIILNGKNYHPQAIEWEVEQVQGVRKGNVVAFSRRGADTEELVVVAETREEDHEALTAEIASQVKKSTGLVISEVVVLSAGGLPKTSSGKLQRAKTKEQHVRGTLGKENRTMGGNATRAVLARHVTSSVFARIRHKVRTVKKRGIALPSSPRRARTGPR